MDKIQQLLNKLETTNIDLAELGLDAVLTEQGPLLIGEARFTVPFSEARYRSLIDRLDVIVLELTASGQIVYSNEATSRITGLSTKELLGYNCLDIIKPSNSTLSIASLHQEFLENVELVDYQTSLVTKDNSDKVISWNTFDIFNNDHQLERIVYFGIDITQRLHDEQELAIAAIAFDSQLAMSIYDTEGIILRINKAYTQLTGYTANEVIGQSCQQTKSDHHTADFYVKKRKIIKDTGTWHGEIWSLRKNGEDYQEHRTVNAVKNNEGLITHYVSTHTDLTERKLADESLSIASVAFETAQGMFVTDAQGFFIHINQAFSDASGYSMTELVGKKPNILKSGLQTDEYYEQMWRSVTEQGSWSGEISNKRKNGEIYLELVHIASVLSEQGSPSHYVANYTDIGKLKAYEAGLIEAKEKAERFSTLKTQFIASMSHEIRTPMAAIIGFSDLALYEEMSEEVRVYLQDINTASTSLLGILQDVLDFTKLEAGRVVIESLPFKMLDLLGTIGTLFSGSAQQKGLVFTIARDSTIPLELLGDKLRLQQVLTNLVGNALKFTAHGTVKLEITLQAMTISQVQLLFCVTDSGIGISLDDQDKLFKEFSQVDGSFSRQYGGTGLGLVISKELVELMGGEISVVSGTGQGSAFSFAVQLGVINESIGHTTQVTPISPKVPSQLTSNKLKGYRILIVEDNVFSQKLIQKHLASFGIDTLLAQHGEEALTLLEEHDFDAILMDIHMPIMNGIEATQRIRQQAKFATLPIIALSAGVTDTERNNCIAGGMVGFVSKPINVEQLCAVLELWLKPKA